ncbi:hypothetical protein V8D89_001659 [Ganoderma adspersum]
MSSPPSRVSLSSRGTSPFLENTFGALLLSTFIALSLYGLTLAQAFRYARLYPSDRPLLKILAGLLTKHSYHYLVTEYFFPTRLFINIWTIDLYPLSMDIDFVLVAGANWRYRMLVFFVMGEQVLLMFVEFSLITARSIIRILIQTGWGTNSFEAGTFEMLSHYSAWMNTLNLAIATVVDLVLTGAFVTIMRQKRTGFSRTDTVLNRLARYAVFAIAGDKAGLVSALAIAAFTCRLKIPGVQSVVLSHSFVYIAIASLASKVYANSVFAVLNCRKSLPPPGNGTDDTEGENVKLSALRERWSPRSADGGGGTRATSVGRVI